MSELLIEIGNRNVDSGKFVEIFHGVAFFGLEATKIHKGNSTKAIVI